MTELSKMYADLTEQEIPLFLHAIGFTDAAVIELNGHYAVFLDPCCFSSLQKFKAALAHEIGHCATGLSLIHILGKIFKRNTVRSLFFADRQRGSAPSVTRRVKPFFGQD